LRFLDAGFAEKYPEDSQPVTRPEDDSLARFGANLVPMDYTAPAVGASPLFNYRYSRTRSVLARVSRGMIDPCHGHALRFLNPTTGRSPIPTIGAYAQLLPSHFYGRPYRTTDSRVFCCLEGEGSIETDAWSFEFAARDVFVVPSWTTYRFTAATESVLFSFSDRPVQQAFGLWREERLP
jgi:gentisate 1,2-dioxygenase